MIVKTRIGITQKGELFITNESDMNVFIYTKINEADETMRRMILPHSTLLLSRNVTLEQLYFNYKMI